MPADVFKTARQFARRPDPGGRVGTAGESADRLKVVKMRQGLVEIGDIERLSERQRLNRLTNIIELLDAADPQPVRPASARRRALSPIKRRLESSICTSRPLHTDTTSMPKISRRCSIIPSDKEKPTANCSRSFGVAIITTWEIPL
jgi:hypothetical protein